MVAVALVKNLQNCGETWGQSTGLTRHRLLTRCFWGSGALNIALLFWELSFPKMKRNIRHPWWIPFENTKWDMHRFKNRSACDKVQDVCECSEVRSFNHCPFRIFPQCDLVLQNLERLADGVDVSSWFRLILSVQIHDFGHINFLEDIVHHLRCSLPMWRMVQRTARLKHTLFFGAQRSHPNSIMCDSLWFKQHHKKLLYETMKHVITTEHSPECEFLKIQSQSLCLGFTLPHFGSSLSVAMEGKVEVDKLKGALNGRPMPVTWFEWHRSPNSSSTKAPRPLKQSDKNPRMSVGNASWEIWRQLNYQDVLWHAKAPWWWWHHF